MPYIDPERRGDIQLAPADSPCLTPGELNYVVSDIVDDYLRENGVSYNTINEVIGVLECAKLELYRRIAAPYEDRKLKENGDVYTVDPER